MKDGKVAKLACVIRVYAKLKGYQKRLKEIEDYEKEQEEISRMRKEEGRGHATKLLRREESKKQNDSDSNF